MRNSFVNKILGYKKPGYLLCIWRTLPCIFLSLISCTEKSGNDNNVARENKNSLSPEAKNKKTTINKANPQPNQATSWIPPIAKRWLEDFGGLKDIPSFLLKELESQAGWSQVQVGGGGYVTGLYVHPQEPFQPWMRTDISGILRWDPSQKRWVKKLLAWPLAKHNQYGVEGLALDPVDPNTVYAALGKYTPSWASNGAIVKSTDGGQSWKELTTPTLRMGGNEFLRYGGERLVVDPLNRNTVFFAPRSNSTLTTALVQPQLLRSLDGGLNWSTLSIDSSGVGPYGITSLVAAGDSPGHFFAASYGKGIYETTNNGETWSDISAPNTFIHRLVVKGKSLFAAGRSNNPADAAETKPSLTRFCFSTDTVCSAAGWTNISPPHVDFLGEGLATVAIHPTQPSVLYSARAASTHDNKTGLLSTLFYSTNAGQTWRSYQPRLQFQTGWLGGSNRYADHVSHIEFLQNGDFWLSDWYGTWFHPQSTSGDYPLAMQEVRGLENTVVFDLHPGPDVSTSEFGGVQLEVLSGLADVDGFPHFRASEFPPAKFLMDSGYNLQATLSFAEAPGNSSLLAKASGNMWSNAGYGNFSVMLSDNGGMSWKTLHMPNDPNRGVPTDLWDESVRARAARVVFGSADGKKLIMLTFNAGIWTSADQGLTWLKNQEINLWNPDARFFSFARPLVSDPLQPGVVYYYHSQSDHAKASFYVSQNAGLNFSMLQDGSTSAGLPKNSRAQLAAGIRGNQTSTYLALVTRNAMQLSFDGGQNWSLVNGVIRADLVGTGAPIMNGSPQTLWMLGEIQHKGEGVFYSTDEGTTWEQVVWSGTDASNEPTVLQPRKDKFGAIYLGTNGSGAWRYLTPN